MLFNSYPFIFAFLPIVLLLWWRLPTPASRLLALTLSSYFFYGWWSWKFLPLMLVSTGIDYIAGNRIVQSTSPAKRKAWLAWSLTANLAILGFFKYSDFFATSVNAGLHHFGSKYSVPLLSLTLPIGISFYTFNSMSYTIDLYRGVVKRTKSLLHYSAFVAMFPHLIAGPIVRYSDIETQLEHLKERLPWEQCSRGIYFFIVGLSKKILIADRLAIPASDLFASHGAAGLTQSWFGVLCYTLQLYFDFSGYSDMAVGLAHLLGIQFPKNFNSPYKAINISDFWRRWHISLSTWLRDYLFIPLGGSSGTTLFTARNLFITMFLGGLWHGAHWTFVVWGLYHGVLLAGYHTLGRKTPFSIPGAVGRGITFVFVTIGWVFFRAASLPEAFDILKRMFGASGMGAANMGGRDILMLGFAFLLTQVAPNTFEFQLKPKLRLAYGLAMLLVLSVSFMGRTSPFLYFQF